MGEECSVASARWGWDDSEEALRDSAERFPEGGREASKAEGTTNQVLLRAGHPTAGSPGRRRAEPEEVLPTY